MRAQSATFGPMIRTGSFSTRLIVDLFYGATRTRLDLDTDDGWSLKWNSEADINGTGTLQITWSDDLGTSLSPDTFSDPLAPFGQEVNLRLEVSASDGNLEVVQLGRFRLVETPSAVDEHFTIMGQTKVAGSRVTVRLADRLVALKRWGFRSEEAPILTASCWGEMARISGMQIVRSLTDVAVPAGLIYKATKGGRLDAVEALAAQLGGTAYMTPEGALSVRPTVWGAIVLELLLGADGTIMDVGQSMESDEVYNEIVGNFETADRTPIFAVAAQTGGPLAVTGPFGVNTEYVTNETVSTQAAADAYVSARLAQSISTQVYRIPVTCILDPRVEDGDVVSVARPVGDPIVGRVVAHSFGDDGLMDLEMDVLRSV